MLEFKLIMLVEGTPDDFIQNGHQELTKSQCTSWVNSTASTFDNNKKKKKHKHNQFNCSLSPVSHFFQSIFVASFGLISNGSTHFILMMSKSIYDPMLHEMELSIIPKESDRLPTSWSVSDIVCLIAVMWKWMFCKSQQKMWGDCWDQNLKRYCNTLGIQYLLWFLWKKLS